MFSSFGLIMLGYTDNYNDKAVKSPWVLGVFGKTNGNDLEDNVNIS